jgi:hypothetical protein
VGEQHHRRDEHRQRLGRQQDALQARGEVVLPVASTAPVIDGSAR